MRNLIVLGLSILVYDILYLVTVLYVPFQTAFELTNTQIGTLLAINSAVSMLCHIISGWLCDRFSPKRCLVAAVFAGGFTALWLSAMPSYPVLKIVFALMASVNFVWPPYIKCMQILSKKGSSGKLFGTAAMIEATVSGVIFLAAVLRMKNGIAESENFSRLILFFAVVILIEGIMLALFLHIDKPAENSKKEKVLLSNVIVVIRMPETWILLLINMCYYGVMTEITYISAYLNQVFLFPIAWTTLFIVVNRFFIRAASTYTGGILRDRMGSVARSMQIACALALLCYGIMIFLPGQPKYLFMAAAVGTVLLFAYYLNSNAANVALTELALPEHLTGTMIGFYSVCTSLINLILQAISGRVLDVYPVQGFRIVMVLACILLGIWIYAGKLLLKYQRNRRRL